MLVAAALGHRIVIETDAVPDSVPIQRMLAAQWYLDDSSALMELETANSDATQSHQLLLRLQHRPKVQRVEQSCNTEVSYFSTARLRRQAP
jgi:hypothetical protein